VIDYTKRHLRRPTRKRCQKCGQVGYYNNGTRRCRMRTFGSGSYCCWGTLTPLRTPRLKSPPPAGVRFRQRAARQLTRARQTLRRWEARQRRAEKLAHKWTLRVAQWERKSQYTDEQVEALRQRAAHAAHVQKVQRRLLKAAGEPSEGGV
jgi:hypothetical protein